VIEIKASRSCGQIDWFENLSGQNLFQLATGKDFDWLCLVVENLYGDNACQNAYNSFIAEKEALRLI